MKTLRTAGLTALAALALAGNAKAGADVSPVAVTHKASDLPAGWNKNAAFMEIFVRSYQDSDGDGVGDFKGLTSRLDYLKGLGVTGIWLMPIMPSADHDHGYAVADYRLVNPEYGTMADFEIFVKEAHKRGIGVILDFVVNHSASTNPLFVDATSSKSSPYRDWYVFADEDPKWPGFQWGPWRKVKGGEGYFYGVFDDVMPDFNLRNPRVVQYLQDTMRFWMNKGVDGFRLDAVTMLIEDGPKNFFNNSENPGIVARLRDTLDSYDNRYMICEVSEKPELYIDACGHAFAYGTQTAIIDSAKKGVVSDAVIKQLQSPMRDAMPLALQSHDAYVGDRLINQFGVNGVGSYRVAAAISILASSTPFSYYGEEIGMSNGGTYNDPGLRSPMSWTGQGPSAGFSRVKPYRDPAINFASMNVAVESGDKASLLAWYTMLYNERRAHPVLGSGDMHLLSKAGDSALVFTRTHGDDQVLVAINLSDTPQVVDADVGHAGTYAGAGVSITADARGHVAIAVPAKSARVLARAR